MSRVHQIQGYIQTIYLVEEEDGFFLLDGCCRPDVPVVKAFIEEELGQSIARLKLVVSTHAHPDHSGGLSYFQKLGIKVAGPKHLNTWYQGFTGLITYFMDILLTYLVATHKKRGIKNIFFPRRVELDFALKEGDKIPGFPKWQVLECPGHTSMDLSIYHPEKNLVYVADNFVSTKSRVYNPYPLCYPEKYKESLQKYIDLNITEFLIAHHGQHTISHECIKNIISTISSTPRRHLNTLPVIIGKLLKVKLKK